MEVSIHLKYERTVHLKMADLPVGRKCKRQNNPCFFLISMSHTHYLSRLVSH